MEEVLGMNDSTHTHLDESQYDYFQHTNVLSRHIISEQKALMKHLSTTWSDLDGKRRDALLDLLFVDDDVRERYTSMDDVGRGSFDNTVPESFPTLFIDSGQKIHVDFENDLWTWRDEHSGPFSWMSRSQQDLTLEDLEPETISKQQSRTAKTDSDTEKSNKLAEEQFTYPVNSWSRDIVDGYRKHEKNIVVTPSSSEYFNKVTSPPASNKNKTMPKDVIYASEEIPKTQGTAEYAENCQELKTNAKERRRRSPSPKKMIRSGSLRRSPSKVSDQGEQKLIADKKDEAYEEINTFSNPIMETEWANFIGEETDTDGPIDKNLNSTLQNEPVIQIIDRGREACGNSPYQGDRIQLISPKDSPSQASGISAHMMTSPGLSTCSAESTPDHSTHLLKGMQREDKSNAQYKDLKQANLATQLEAKNFEEKDEVLTVEMDGENLTIVSDMTKDEESVHATGFDFLDNW